MRLKFKLIKNYCKKIFFFEIVSRQMNFLRKIPEIPNGGISLLQKLSKRLEGKNL